MCRPEKCLCAAYMVMYNNRRRIPLDMNQEEVAAQLNIRRQTLSAYETGRSVPNIYILLELASFFRVSIEDLTRNVKL